MLTGFQPVKTGNKRNVNVFRRFNGKPLMYVFPWKVTITVAWTIIGSHYVRNIKSYFTSIEHKKYK